MSDSDPASSSNRGTGLVSARDGIGGEPRWAARFREGGGCIRNGLRPGDLGSLISLHGSLYAAECGWDATFEAYVAGPLAEFALAPKLRDRIWIVEHRAQVAGSIAVVELQKHAAQLRWFLLHPSLRGMGLGRLLLHEALAFSRQAGFTHLQLWTTRNLVAAAHLYCSAGFELSQELTHPLWGQMVTEQRYDLRL